MMTDLLTRPPPTESALAEGNRLARRGYLRSEIVRATGLTADEVSAIKRKIEDEAAQGRCSKTEDMFG
jgi:hypothetical protein